MPKIAVVEILAVRHFVTELCKIVQAGNNEVVLFSTPRIYEKLAPEMSSLSIQVVLAFKGESQLHFLRRIGGEISCGGFDHCIINTYRAWQFLFFRPRIKKIVRKFNLNWMFKDTTLVGYLKGLTNAEALKLKDPTRNAVTGPILRRLMLRSVDAVLVEYPPFVDYVKAAWGSRPPAYFLPLTCFEAQSRPESRRDPERITFAVPGIVTELRRDYDLVLDAFEVLYERHGAQVELILLGSADSDSIVARCEELARRGFSIKYYREDFVALETYDAGLRDADVLIAPLKLDFRYREVRETYTVSKGSGFFADSLKFGKPCVVPQTSQLPDEYQDAFLRYGTKEELIAILTSLVTNSESMDKIKAAALDLYGKLTPENLGARLNQVLSST